MAKIVELPGGGIEFQYDDPTMEQIRRDTLKRIYADATEKALELFRQTGFVKALEKEKL